MMQTQINVLVNVLKNAQEQINEIENLQKYLEFSTKKELFDCVSIMANKDNHRNC